MPPGSFWTGRAGPKPAKKPKPRGLQDCRRGKSSKVGKGSRLRPYWKMQAARLAWSVWWREQMFGRAGPKPAKESESVPELLGSAGPESANCARVASATSLSAVPILFLFCGHLRVWPQEGAVQGSL